MLTNIKIIDSPSHIFSCIGFDCQYYLHNASKKKPFLVRIHKHIHTHILTQAKTPFAMENNVHIHIMIHIHIECGKRIFVCMSVLLDRDNCMVESMMAIATAPTAIATITCILHCLAQQHQELLSSKERKKIQNGSSVLICRSFWRL